MNKEADVARCVTQNDEFCLLAFHALLDCQTADELASRRTIHSNAVGFNMHDAPRASKFMHYDSVWDLDPPELREIREMVLRYDCFRAAPENPLVAAPVFVATLSRFQLLSFQLLIVFIF